MLPLFFFFFFNDTATTEIYTLSLHDALPISRGRQCERSASRDGWWRPWHSPRLPDPLVGLRLRGAAGRLIQCAQDGAPRQLDLEVVVAEATRILQHNFGGAKKVLSRRRRSVELRFGFTVAPRLVRDPAEREPRFFDRVALDVEADRDGDQGERIRQAITDFEISVIFGEAFGWQFDGRDDLVRQQIAVDLRRLARQAMEVGKGDAALATLAVRQYPCFQGSKCHAHVRRMRGDTVLARSQDRMHAVDAVNR